MDIEINRDLLTVMRLRCLPKSFENFRCAIASRDELPTAETMRVKILEEYESRKESRGVSNNAMVTGRSEDKRNKYQKDKSKRDEHQVQESKIKCYKCHKFGHFAKNCDTNK